MLCDIVVIVTNIKFDVYSVPSRSFDNRQACTECFATPHNQNIDYATCSDGLFG